MTTQFPFIEKDNYKNKGVMDSTVLVEDGVVWDQGELQMSLNYESNENALIENNNESYLTAAEEDGSNTQYFSLLETTNETILNGLNDMTLYTHGDSPEEVSEQGDDTAICALEDQLDVFTIGGSDDLYAYQVAYDQEGNMQRYRYMLRLNGNGEYETVSDSLELISMDKEIELPTNEIVPLNSPGDEICHTKITRQNNNPIIKKEEPRDEIEGISNDNEDSYHELQVNEDEEFYSEDETFTEGKSGAVTQRMLQIEKVEAATYCSGETSPIYDNPNFLQEDNDNMSSMEPSISESSTNVLESEELTLRNFGQAYTLQADITNDNDEPTDDALEQEQLIISESCPLPEENEEISKSPISNYSEEHFHGSHAVELMDDIHEENESEGEEFQIVDGVHVTGDNDENETDGIAQPVIEKDSENQILKLQENISVLPPAIDNKIKNLLKRNGNKVNKSLMYYVVKPEKENVEHLNSNKLIKVNPRSVLKSSFKYLEQKANKEKLQADVAKVEKRPIKAKEQPGRVFTNFLAKTTIIHAPIRQERLPRKQTIKPVKRADEEIIVQEVVVSSNGFIETTEDGVLKSKTELVPTDFVQVTDSDEDYNARAEQKKKKKKKKRRSKITKIVISDSEDDFSDDVVQIDLSVESDDEQNNGNDNSSSDKFVTPVSSNQESNIAITDTFKRKRGRPRKRPSSSLEESSIADSSSSSKKLKSSNDSESSDLVTPKKFDPTKIKTKWNCTSCPKVFPSQGSLKTHMQFHAYHESNSKNNLFKKPLRTTPKPNNYRCTVCCETFKNNYLLIKHIKEHNDPSSFECSICKKLFSDQLQLRNHKRSHVKEQMFNSTTLPKDSPKSKKIVRKARLSILGETHKCTFCPKTFTSQMLLDSHTRLHKRFTCLSCASTFVSKLALEDHVRCNCVKKSHSPNQSLSLKTKSFLTPLHRAIRLNSPLKNISSNKDGGNSSSSSDKDLRTPISAKQISLKCDKCSMVFKSHTNLFNHKVIKHGLETPDKNIKANKKKLLHKETGKHSSVPVGEKLRNAFANLKSVK